MTVFSRFNFSSAMLNQRPKLQNKKCQKVSIRKSAVAIFSIAITTLIAPQTVFAAPVENFGQDLFGLRQAYANKRVHILQLGDSHTAGDYFTEQLRKRLQAEVGDGGLGFAYPMGVRGQRVARHGYDSGGWTLYNSRFDREVSYPLGGMVASPDSASSYLTVTSEYYKGDQQHARIIINGLAGQKIRVSDRSGLRSLLLTQNGWQTLNTIMTFPATIQADPSVEIGGTWLNRSSGGTVSAMGINGATQDYWDRWHSTLAQDFARSHADLVILAYGTNEALRSNVSNQKAKTKQAIATIRQGLPNASILVVGAPESLSQTSDGCGVRTQSLDSVQYQLRTAAAESGALYWSWENAMGGACSMMNWIDQGLGRSDGIHFTRAGYERAANDLYSNLKQLLATGSNNSASNTTYNQYGGSGNTNSVKVNPYTPSSNLPSYGATLNDYSSTKIRLEKNNDTVTITNLPSSSASICSTKTGKCMRQ